jgi:hypothetical protein
MMMPKDKKEKKSMPITVMVAVGKPSMPVRGSRTAKSKASKAKKAK